MSDEDKDKGLHVTKGGSAVKPPPPRTIAAQSQAWNNSARTVIFGICLFTLLVLVGIALYVRPEVVKDLVWAVITIVAYLAGSAEAGRKEEK